MPAGVAALARLRLARPLEGAPFMGIRYHYSGRTVLARFPMTPFFPQVGLGCRRRILDQTIFETAQNTSGVKVHTGVRVQAPFIEGGRISGLVVEGESLRGRLVIAADGARSGLRHRMGLDVPDRRKRIGLRAHFRLAPGQLESDWVNIHLRQGYELYATPLCHREIIIAALAEADSLEGPIEKQFQTWCRLEPDIAAVLEGALQITDLQVVAPLSGGARRTFLPGCVLLGDAAGFADPITGGGMTQALLAAEMFAQFAAEGLAGANLWLQEFDKARKELLRDYRRLTDIMLWLAGHRSLATCLLGVLGRQPRLFAHLLGVASNTHRLLGGRLALISLKQKRRSLHRFFFGAKYESDLP